MASLPTAHFVALRPPFLIRWVLRVETLPLKLVTFCKIFASFSSTKKTATSLSFSSSQIFALLLPHTSLLHPCFYLTLSSISGRNYSFSLLSLQSDYNGFPVPRFFQRMARPMSHPGEVLIQPSTALVVSLLSLVSTHLFSQTGGLMSHQNSLAHRFPQYPLKNFIVTFVVSSLVFAATETAFFQKLVE